MLATSARGSMVAIPAYNEELTIGSIVARARRTPTASSLSTTALMIVPQKWPELVGAEVFGTSRRGYGSAIRDCFEIARDCDVDVLVTLDGDGQHNPDDIPQLIDEMRESGADIVIGSRFARGAKKRDDSSATGNLDEGTRSRNMPELRLRVTDSQSGFRAYSRKRFTR